MAEKKTLAEANSLLKKERFEFVLSFNGNIVCQRYFRIFGIEFRSFNSMELVDTIKGIADIINSDLEAKTQTYLELVAPQFFDDETEMNTWLEKHGSELRTPTFIALRNSEQNYLWNGEKVKPYSKSVNKHEFMENDEQPSYLTFTFYDNGPDMNSRKEVISYTWDISTYPKFVRFNIDLSNTKNPFKDDYGNVISSYEAILIDAMKAGHKDLVPQIVHEFYDCCTSKEGEETVEYTTEVEYGDRTYNLHLYRENMQYEKSYEQYFDKKYGTAWREVYGVKRPEKPSRKFKK